MELFFFGGESLKGLIGLLAEREGFEPSMFSLSSMAYKAILSRSCLMVLEAMITGKREPLFRFILDYGTPERI